jgi:glycosyltransferase involved in cell wall biosynthesis
MTAPFLSVVMPTCGRPQYLPRAIESALQAAPDGDVEVIVVPNGPDGSWKSVAAGLAHESRVQWHPILTAHANVARNHGMDLARGKYLRFLDDDDYLFEAASRQCVQLDASDYDASLGGIDLVDDAGSMFQQWVSDATNDYVVSMLRPTRITHNCALLWRRQCVADRRWDTACSLGQDTAWALEIARDTDLSLLKFLPQTGAWVHHTGQRISKRTDALGHNQTTVGILINAISGLEKRAALTDDRRIAAAQGVWQCIHNAFPLAPRYWSRVITYVLQLAPESRPDDKAYMSSPLKHLSPWLAEWLMTPHRLARFRRRERARAKGLLPPW